MAEETYRIVFNGEVALWSDIEEVKRNIGAMFKVDGATVDRMFAARPAVIKSGIDHGTAVRYKMAFEQTGAVCTIELIVAADASAPWAAAPADDDQSAAAAVEDQASAPTGSADGMVCPKCGQRQPESTECTGCGIIVDKYVRLQSMPADVRREAAVSEGGAGDAQRKVSEERTWAMLCHLSALAGCILPLGNVLGPLIVWLLKKDQSAFIDGHGKAALDFQVTVSLVLLLAIPVSFLGITKYILIPLVVVLLCYTLYIIILSAMKAHRGEDAEIGPSLALFR